MISRGTEVVVHLSESANHPTLFLAQPSPCVHWLSVPRTPGREEEQVEWAWQRRRGMKYIEITKEFVLWKKVHRREPT